jgi:hypothetical protein
MSYTSYDFYITNDVEVDMFSNSLLKGASNLEISNHFKISRTGESPPRSWYI